MSYVLHPHRGVCFSAENRVDKRAVLSDGLDQFDWSVLPDVELPAPAETDPVKKKGKEARKERKERRRIKTSQLAAAAHDKLSRVGLASASSAEIDDFNPYIAARHLSDMHAQICKSTKGDEDTKLFKAGSVDIYKSDVNYILPGEWLNDNNISFMYEMIISHFLKDHAFGFQIQLLFPALIQLFLHFPIEEDLPTMLPMKDLAKSKLVFLPFNFMDSDDYVDLEDANNGDHWALCVLSMPERKLYVYDSMAFDGENDDALLHQLASRLQKTLFKPNEKITIMKMKCDQQQNFDDCGVFLIMFSCYLIAQLLSGEPTDLKIANVKFNPMSARVKIMEIVYKLSLEAQGKSTSEESD